MPAIMSVAEKQISADIFDRLRAGFARVAALATHVRINEDRLHAYARDLLASAPPPVFDTEHHYVGSPEDTAAYVLTLDAINYGSGYKAALAAEGWDVIEGSIYYSVSVRLKHAFDVQPLTARDLSAMTPERVRDILQLPDGPQSMRVSSLFATGLSDLGRMIECDHAGLFMNFVQAAQGKAAYIVEQLSQLPQFADVHSYKGADVAFYKRAQIAAADLHLAFTHLGLSLFDDMGRLTMFADNGVPQVLEADHVLIYDPALKARIVRGEEITSGSAEEVEIRGCGAHAVEKLVMLLNKTAVQTDHILWHRHAEDPRYRAHPSHRTLSVYY